MAKDEAANVKDTAVDAGKNVAATAKGEAANVVQETKQQAQSLLSTVTSEVRDQGRNQQQRIATAVHSLSKELGGMASASEESGPLTDLAQQASRKGGEIAHWLEDREPSDVLDEVKRFARRRPVMFLGSVRRWPASSSVASPAAPWPPTPASTRPTPAPTRVR